jgi:flagellar FliL protein
MANLEVVEAPAPVEAAEPAVSAGRRGKLLPLGLIFGAVIAGVAIGLLLLAPRFSSPPAVASGPASVSKAAKHGSAPKAGKHGAGVGSVIEIKNVVVNPAGAEGSHFLMATVALEVHDKVVEDHLRTNEHVVKDIVMSTLSQETMDMLRQPGARDQLKVLLTRAISDYVGGSDAVTVFLPEFVVQ